MKLTGTQIREYTRDYQRLVEKYANEGIVSHTRERIAKAVEKPAERLFNKVSKTMYSRVSAGKCSKQLYKERSKEARQKRDACSAGELSVEDYAIWLAEALGRNPLTDE